MKVKVTVKLNNSKIRQLEEANKQAFKLTVEDVLQDIKDSQVVPKDTGRLENSGTIEFISEVVASIIFQTPYARRLYFNPNFNFHTDKNANAQGMWMDMYVNGDKKDFIISQYSMHLKELSKGLVT
ncbi:MAG: minor capsid protein [Bacillota bacterium]|nr:minor capsid protein [Bacillota bacterium]